MDFAHHKALNWKLTINIFITISSKTKGIWFVYRSIFWYLFFLFAFFGIEWFHWTEPSAKCQEPRRSNSFRWIKERKTEKLGYKMQYAKCAESFQFEKHLNMIYFCFWNAKQKMNNEHNSVGHRSTFWKCEQIINEQQHLT